METAGSLKDGGKFWGLAKIFARTFELAGEDHIKGASFNTPTARSR